MSLSPDQIVYIFIGTPIYFFTCVPVFISILALSRIKDASLFAYLKFEMIFILLDCLIYSFSLFSACNMCFSLNRYIICFYEFYGLDFLSSVVEMTSGLMSILAALSCLLMLNASTNNSSRLSTLFSKCNPGLLAIFSFIFSTLIFSYQLTVPIPTYSSESNMTDDSYCVWIDSFQSAINRFFVITSYVISYGVFGFVLIVVNIFIVLKLRKNLKNNSVSMTSQAKRKTIEHKLTKLIVFDCFNLIIGKCPIMAYFIVGELCDINLLTFPLGSLSTVMIFISYDIKFAIYYKLNSKFKNESLRIVSFVFKLGICKRFWCCFSEKNNIGDHATNSSTRIVGRLSKVGPLAQSQQ